MTIIFDNGIYQVETNGVTLWVNTHTMLGRLSPRGSDVHVDGACRPGSCTPEPDWNHFAEQMMKWHGIDVHRYKDQLEWLDV